MRKDSTIRFFYENRSNNLPDLPMDEFYDNFIDENFQRKSDNSNTNNVIPDKSLTSQKSLFDDEEAEPDVPNRVMKVI